MGLYKLWQELHSELLTAAAEKEAIIKEIDYLTHICQELKVLDLSYSHIHDQSKFHQNWSQLSQVCL